MDFQGGRQQTKPCIRSIHTVSNNVEATFVQKGASAPDETAASGAQSHPELQSNFEANLGFTRPSQKPEPKELDRIVVPEYTTWRSLKELACDLGNRYG